LFYFFNENAIGVNFWQKVGGGIKKIGHKTGSLAAEKTGKPSRQRWFIAIN